MRSITPNTHASFVQSSSDRGAYNFKPLGIDYFRRALLKMLFRIYFDTFPIKRIRSLTDIKLKTVISPSFDSTNVVFKL
jgi:hypothetical protein